MNVATNAAARPTKIDVSDPLIVFFSTSRPHLSAPNGNVAARASTGTAAVSALPFWMSAMMSASGSTLVLAAGADFCDWISFITSASGSTVVGAVDVGDDAGGAVPLSCAITSPSGSTTVDWKVVAAVGAPDDVSGPVVGAVDGSSAPAHVGGA